MIANWEWCIDVGVIYARFVDTISLACCTRGTLEQWWIRALTWGSSAALHYYLVTNS